eukprot:s2359_g10.t1
MPSGPEQLRLRLTVMQNALLMIGLQHPRGEKYKDYLLGDYCYGLRSNETSGSLAPPWTLVLSYENAIRKHAYKQMVLKGIGFADALEILNGEIEEDDRGGYTKDTNLGYHINEPEGKRLLAGQEPTKDFHDGGRELEKEAFRMASGGEDGCKLARDPDLQRELLDLRPTWTEGQDLSEKELMEIPPGRPLRLRLLRAILQAAGDPDRELDNAPWEPALAWVPNYSSAGERREFVKAKFDEDVEEGLMEKMTLGESGSLFDVELVEPYTAKLRLSVWEVFKGWLHQRLLATTVVKLFSCPPLLALVLRDCGDELYKTGFPLGYYRQLLAHSQRVCPLVKPHLGIAWEMVSR